MREPECWIGTVAPEDAGPELAAAYDAVSRSDGSVHNMYRTFASRPDLMILADRFYRALLHNPRRTLEDWLQEVIATQVAILCGCRYARDNHGENMVSLLGDRADARMRAILVYTRKLTLEPAAMAEADVAALREAGLDDAAIFEVNQIAACFAYWSRMLNGLGVTAEGERIGIYDDGP